VSGHRMHDRKSGKAIFGGKKKPIFQKTKNVGEGNNRRVRENVTGGPQVNQANPFQGHYNSKMKETKP